MRLNETAPETAGRAPGNGFDEAFLTNGLVTWLSSPVPRGMRIDGNVTLEAWIDVTGQLGYPSLAEPGTDYAFLNQFGSDRGFQSSYVREDLAATELQGIVHLNETFVMPPGGYVIEKGDRLQLLITSLILDDGGDPGTFVLFGGDTPSRLTFTASCYASVEWSMQRYLRQPVVMAGNQGGPIGVPGVGCTTIGPQDLCLNRFEYDFTLENGTDRLRVFIRTAAADQQPKRDMDVRLLNAAQEVVYDASTPFVNETFVLWRANLDAFLPPGPYTVRCDLYSGANYSGLLEIAMEHDPHEDGH